MHRIIGKRIVEFGELQLVELVAAHERVVIEVGAGNGAFLRALVASEPMTLAIGFDPTVDALERPSRLAAKQGDNPVFLRAAIEAPPPDLAGLADALYAIFRGLPLQDLSFPKRRARQHGRPMKTGALSHFLSPTIRSGRIAGLAGAQRDALRTADAGLPSARLSSRSGDLQIGGDRGQPLLAKRLRPTNDAKCGS
jgi:hypothetical protein